MSVYALIRMETVRLKNLRRTANEYHLDSCTPFLLFLTKSHCIDWVVKFRPKVLFMDLTGGTNIYGYPLAVLLALNECGNGVPLSYMITSNESADTISRFLDW